MSRTLGKRPYVLRSAAVALALILTACWVIEDEVEDEGVWFNVNIEFVDANGQTTTCEELGIVQLEVEMEYFVTSGACCTRETVMPVAMNPTYYEEGAIKVFGFTRDGEGIAYANARRQASDREITIPLALGTHPRDTIPFCY